MSTKKKSQMNSDSPSQKWLWLGVLALLGAIFLYIRIHAISLETVPYTYDQGRDFMAARNIVVNKDITLIGPTTGAEGVFHGAWWYYFLAVPFLLFQGQPLGFYYFIALIAFVQVILFSYFLKKDISGYIALVFIGIVAVSPYFIKTSVFAINSVLTLPFVLLLMFTVFKSFKESRLMYSFLIGWSAGMIAEAELAFGIFLLPSLLIAAAVSRNFKAMFGSVRKILLVLVGLGSAMVLRMMFELKNNFLQTRALFSFSDAAGTQPNTVLGVFKDRMKLFTQYYMSLFPDGWEVFALVLLVVSVVGLVLGYRKFAPSIQNFTRFLIALLVALFLTSLLYKNSFFWEYYFEGIHYMLLVMLLLGLYGYRSFVSQKTYSYGMGLLVAIFVCIGLVRVGETVQKQLSQESIGLLMHTEAISYLYSQVGSEEFCLRMYTPPVRTHTYDYLLDLQSRSGIGMYPRTEFVNNECWYFIESDSFAPRRQAWLDSNLPAGGAKVHSHKVSDDLVIEKWSTQNPEE